MIALILALPQRFLLLLGVNVGLGVLEVDYVLAEVNFIPDVVLHVPQVVESETRCPLLGSKPARRLV